VVGYVLARCGELWRVTVLRGWIMVCHSILEIHVLCIWLLKRCRTRTGEVSEPIQMKFPILSCRHLSLNLMSIPVTVISMAVVVMSTLVRFVTI
jgi:hypothetical protein